MEPTISQLHSQSHLKSQITAFYPKETGTGQKEAKPISYTVFPPNHL